MNHLLLATKLHRPATPPGWMHRPRLLARLNAGLHQQLMLISAAAGFGKTTLVSDWLHQMDVPAAWLSLDAGDNDPHRLLTHVVAAIQHIAPSVGQAAWALLQAPHPLSVELVLTSLINDLAARSEPLLFVLDDYHFIEQPVVHAACAFLLHHMPPAMHLVIITREDPPLPLERLRVRRQMTEIRSTDLRLTEQETLTFLNELMGLDLSAEDASALATRTEGWVTGLHLVALSLRAHDNKHAFVVSFAGDDRYVADYLVSEVLGHQPAPVQQFLLWTSILDRFCGPLCDAVMTYTLTGGGQPDTAMEVLTASAGEQLLRDSQTMLEYLERANLFVVPLDNRREWYRYHHLFADLLRHRLQRRYAAHIPTLHRHAATWYEHQGLIDEALHHLLLADEPARAARLIEQQGRSLFWTYGQTSILSRWLHQFPPAHLYAHPQLCLLFGWVMYIMGRYDAIEPYLQAAETHWQHPAAALPMQAAGAAQQGSFSPIELDAMIGEVTLLRAFVASMRGNSDLAAAALAPVQQILAHLPPEAPLRRGALGGGVAEIAYLAGDVLTAGRFCREVLALAQSAKLPFLALLCMSRRVDIHIIQGQLHQAASLCQQMRQLMAEKGQHVLGGVWADVLLSRVLYEWNDLDTALHLLRQGIERGRQAGMQRLVVEALITLAQLLNAQGDRAGAAQTTQEALHLMHHHHVLQDWGRLAADTCQAQIWLRQGNVAAAARWSQEQIPPVTDQPGYQHELTALTLAHILIQQDKAANALALLERLRPDASAGERWGRVIELAALQALALQVQGKGAAALTALAEAVTLAEPHGYVRLFVDKGEPMARLLRRLKEEPGVPKPYIRALLAAFAPAPQATGAQGQPLPAPRPANGAGVYHFAEPLSEREKEVLHLIASGLSNQDIAHRLVLTAGTVKVHIHHIYRKLDVKSRTQAVARAQALGILAAP